MKTVTTREEFLRELKKHLPKKCSGAEIGVLSGDFSEMILEIIEPETLALIDPYSISESKYDEAMNNLATAYSTDKDYENLLARFGDKIKEEQVLVSRKFSYDAYIDFPDNGFNFLYVDASHLYFDVKKDLNDWLPKLKLDGIFAGHDYIENKSFGVIQAVNEFMQEHNFEMVLINENGGDWALKRKA